MTDFKTLEVEGFTLSEDKPATVKVLLNDNRFILATIMDFAEINENAYMYFNDAFYYNGEIMAMIDDFINEAEYTVQNED